MPERREYLPNPETQEVRRVVRAFIVQAKSLERIQEEFASLQDPRDLFLTKVLLAEKSKESQKNAGQVMPVGGKVDSSDRSDDQALLREILEETHLRPIEYEPLATPLQYSLQTPEAPIQIEQKMYVAKILPSDYAYPLHPEEDKIAKFHGLDLGQLGALYSGEIIENDNSKIELLGNLRLPIEGVSEDTLVKLDESQKQIPLEVFDELSQSLSREEIKKRESVRKILFQTLPFDSEIQNEWNQKFQKVQENFFEYQNVWSECLTFLQTQHDFEKHFFAAVDLSNFQEEVESSLPRQSEVESVIRFVYSLINTRYDFDKYFEVAKENVKLTNFVQKIESFFDILSNTGEKKDSLSQTLAEKAKHIEEFPEELLAHAFCESFELDEKNVASRLERINKFIASVVDTGIHPRVGGRYHKNLVSPISDISGAQLGKLIKYGFSLDKPKWGKRTGKDVGLRKRMVFEARRSLSLLYLFTKVDEYYASVMEKGKQPLEELTEGCFTLPIHSAVLVVKENTQNELENVQILPGGTAFEEIPGFVQETKFREFIHLEDSSEKKKKPSFWVGNEVRTKQMDSVYRKAIVRGSDDPASIQDIYGRSLTLVPDLNDRESEKYLIQREKRNIFLDGKMQEVEDFAPVLDILEYYSQQKDVRVFKYKGTPKEGAKMVSSGVGGGNIRAAKFYVEHCEIKDEKKIFRYEEIQIFSPSEDGKTAVYWEKKKKEDDARYFLDRMLDAKGLRSFIELMFPTTIFGEPVYALQRDKRQRKRKHSKKK